MTLDAEGRVIDENGKVIELGKIQSDLKINQKIGGTAPKAIDGAAGQNQSGERAQGQTQDYQQQLKKRMFYDSSLD